MNNRAYALMTGIFVTLLVVVVVGAGMWMSGLHEKTLPYVVVTTGNVNGLQPQSTVLFRGIAAGTVEKIVFDKSNAANIFVYIDVDEDATVTQATYATLRLQGLTGLSQLSLDNGRGPLAMKVLQTSTDAPARIPMHPSLIDELTDSSGELARRLDQLTAGLAELVNPENRSHIHDLLAHADEAAGRLVTLEKDLDETARRLPALGRQTDATLAEIQRVSVNLNTLSQDLDKVALSGQAAGGDLVGKTLPRLDAALAQINSAAAEVDRLAKDIRRDPQQLLLGPSSPAPGPGESGNKEPPR
ncbi:MAG TPA: MlaD family protein [Steroidobacteraceae bacterium]|jgi:phospholipid/cholesterol/gamma-HCH transport system substrate-binding protein